MKRFKDGNALHSKPDKKLGCSHKTLKLTKRTRLVKCRVCSQVWIPVDNLTQIGSTYSIASRCGVWHYYLGNTST